MNANQVQRTFKGRNIGAVTSQSVDRKRTTVINHFNEFMAIHHEENDEQHPYSTFAAAVQNKEYMESEDMLGAFGDYLSIGRSASQSAGCFSTFMAMLRNDYRMSIRADFVTRCRTIISKEFLEKCVREGKDPENNARPMTMYDLSLYSEILFKQSTFAGMQSRAALILQWQTLGRVSEVFALKLSDITYCKEINANNRALMVNVNRMKVSARNKLRLFIHKTNPFACPLHAMASYILVARISNDLFPDIDSDGAARITNAMLKSLREALARRRSAAVSNFQDEDDNEQKQYTSHSLRSGGSTFLSEHRDIKSEYINERGGWSIRGQDHSLRYKWSTALTDGAVGRVLSGWRHIDSGGFLPYPDESIIPAHDQELFGMYSAYLFKADNYDIFSCKQEI